MYNYKNLFGKIRTPYEWKNNLYERLEADEKISVSRPAVSVKRIVSVAAAAAAVFALTVTAAAVTGFLNLSDAMQSGMNDEISAEKLLKSAYQPLDVTAENDSIALTAAAFLGDKMDSFVILEARPKNIPEGVKRLGIDVRIFDSSAGAEAIDNLGADRYYGIPQQDENGNKVYVFRAKSYPFWTENSIENNLPLTVQVVNICYDFSEDGDAIVPELPANIKLSFIPDGSIISEPEAFALGNEVSVDGLPCTLGELKVSDYCERLLVDYTLPDNFRDILFGGYDNNYRFSEWTGASEYGRRLMRTDKLDNSVSHETSSIRLIADGKYIPYLGTDLDGSARVLWDFTDDEGNYYHGYMGGNECNPVDIGRINYSAGGFETKDFELALCFEPFDFDAAESVVIEIETAEGVFETFTVK